MQLRKLPVIISPEIPSKILKKEDYKKGFLMGFRKKIPLNLRKAASDDFCH
jgi:hypothetical protein